MTNTNNCNNNRIEAAASALAVYSKVRSLAEVDSAQALDEMVIDLLTDLRHLAAMERLDFAAVLKLSRIHFRAESKVELRDEPAK